MNPTSENENAELAKALLEAENGSNPMQNIDSQVRLLANSMAQETLEMRGVTYARSPFCIGALLSYSPDVRMLAAQAGVDLQVFDQAVRDTTTAVKAACLQDNTIAFKLVRAIRDSYSNGLHR